MICGVIFIISYTVIFIISYTVCFLLSNLAVGKPLYQHLQFIIFCSLCSLNKGLSQYFCLPVITVSDGVSFGVHAAYVVIGSPGNPSGGRLSA